jgi:uncharacterized repeat protein (TIGR02543 family)
MKKTAKKLFIMTSILLMAILAVSLLGCRIIEGFFSYDNDTGTSAPNLSLSGSILVDPDSLSSLLASHRYASKSLLPADLSGYVGIEGAEVWIEELPDFPHQITDKDGKYTFTGLPAGDFHIISAYKKLDNSMMKVRSEPVVIAAITDIATASALALAPADKVVTGVLRDDNGDFVPAGTVLILWGEKFVVGQEGQFTTPALPNDVEIADIIFAKADIAVADRPVIPVQFYSAEAPTVVEMQVGSGQDDFTPFTAVMNVKINGQAVNVIQNSDIVDLSLSLKGLDRNAPGVTYEWDSGRGSFATYPTISDSAIWLAPDTSGMAVISVKISAPGHGSFKVALPLVVDVPVKAPRFALTFDSGSGSSVSAQSIEAGAKAVEPFPPTLAAYKFAGWYKEAALVNQWNFALDKVTAATTVYARWLDEAVLTHILTFSSQGGSPIVAQIIESGTNAAEPAEPIRSGYAFAGWYKETALTNQWNFAVDTVTSDTTIYAKWQTDALPYYRVLFDPQGGSRVIAQLIKSGSNVSEPAAATKDGYELAGWYKDLALQNQWNFVTDTVSADMTLYAKWVTATVKFYRVTFAAQGGSDVPMQTIQSDAQVVEPAAPIRTGYVFAGWYKEAAASNLWNFLADKVTTDTTVYAKWIPETVGNFMVTFNSQSGSAVEAQLVASGALAVAPTVPTLASFTFAGWYKEAELINQWDFATDAVSANTTLYAKWTSNLPEQFTLTYTAGANGAITGTSPQTVVAGGSGTPVLAVANTGYLFSNWSDARTDNPRTDLNLNGNVSVTAIFLEIGMKTPGINKYAYSENAGWINFAPTNGNVFVKLGSTSYLSGTAWSENLGWIKFAADSATAPYGNTTATNWGVNIGADGKLVGYAWSENAGWINFAAAQSTAAIDMQTGALSGYAWGENIGWVKFAGSAYRVQFAL